MSYRRFVTTAIIATLSLSALPSFAQSSKHGNVIVVQQAPNHRSDDRRDRRADRRDDRQDRRNDRREDRRDDRADRRDDRRYSRGQDRRAPAYYYNARGPEFRRGHHIPGAMRSPQYVVINYRQHHLQAPPRGHQWIQVGADYVLIAVATGLIANILLNH